MSFALSPGVTGPQALQQILDLAGGNLTDDNTVGNLTFSEMLNETTMRASQFTAGSSTPALGQGSIVQTGNPFDVAIEGDGYFVLSEGSQDLYTRSGVFGIDADMNLIDPATGYRVQRLGSDGESLGFQNPGDSNIRIPYDRALPASATSSVKVQGNLSSDAKFATPQTQALAANIAYTVDGLPAAATTKLNQTDQFSAEILAGTITITGVKKDGNKINSTLTVDENTTLGDVISKLNTDFSGEAVASLNDGQITLTGSSSGYSKLNIVMTCDDNNLTMPGYFEYSTVGGDEVQNVNITIFDSKGNSHVQSGALVRTDVDNKWDMVLTTISGDVSALSAGDRRIEGIGFNAENGSYAGIAGNSPEFAITFAHDAANPQTVSVDFGTAGSFNGLTQFTTGQSGTSTAVASEQDGYASGTLSSVSINDQGQIVGSFSNGVKKNIATMQIAVFQNPAGLESIGGSYLASSSGSGQAVVTHGSAGGAGIIHGGALEKSNADVANDFVTMTQAQNGFQANARTIEIANNILRELTNLIR